MHKHNKGFTLVELLIVIVVIAILAAITVVVYNGLSSRAQDASVISNLNSAHKKLTLYYQENGTYPEANECPNPSPTNICLPAQSSVALVYTPNNSTSPPSYLLVATTGSKVYSVTSATAPTNGIANKSPYTISNAVDNGDFNSGFRHNGGSWDSWQNHNNAPSTSVIASGQLTVNAVSGGRSASVQYLRDSPCDDQDKMYFAISVKKISGSDATASHHRDQGGYEQGIMTTSQFNSMVPGGSFGRFSSIRICKISEGTYTAIQIASYSNSKTFQMVADNVIAVNLTKDFGAGNEPTAAQMDEIVRQQVPNQFFNSTTTVYK
jgi:prepilin-type N-terminal cleavage/methylation domain-containing protein